ncbi:GDSL-type esterase/lipase family protein [Frankia sp. R82]|uniref:GDSL-type esterase/lipase family protein n=1 Tax=Frankia sp. R82 TaxID=2950553 RepID=UPI0020448C6F|nr:GDSL-type esterase/lipase family protein [Frankia sp. R82]MCM3887372.1 GDSL-type esterase/lipase family protein [Frankia sp. R82]
MNTDRIYSVLVPTIRPIVRATNRPRIAQFEAAPLAARRVVFLGDSITQGGFWDAWFPELLTLNRGVNGDTTTDVIHRLDSAIFKPAAVSLLIGTNDLHGKPRERILSGISDRTHEIINRIQDASPDTTILLNSVLPRTAHLAARIQELNAHYRTIAQKTGATYVDLWPALADGLALHKEYTQDNLHLVSAGYRAWTGVLRPHLAPFAVSGPGEK